MCDVDPPGDLSPNEHVGMLSRPSRRPTAVPFHVAGPWFLCVPSRLDFVPSAPPSAPRSNYQPPLSRGPIPLYSTLTSPSLSSSFVAPHSVASSLSLPLCSVGRMAAISAYSLNLQLPRPLPNFSTDTHRPYRFDIKLLCSLGKPNHSELLLWPPAVTHRFCRKGVLAGCAKSDPAATAKGVLIEEPRVLDIGAELRIDGGGCGGDDDNVGGGGGGDGGEGSDGGEEDEFGPLMKFADIMREAEARGVKLPADMLEAAKATGLPKVILERYLEMQVHFVYT